jgi:hypothetical protein
MTTMPSSEEIGLKLEAATAPLDVLVVDYIERPAANYGKTTARTTLSRRCRPVLLQRGH